MATEAEVRQAYEQQLGRAPDAEGLAHWMKEDSGFDGGKGANWLYAAGQGTQTSGSTPPPAGEAYYPGVTPQPTGGGMVMGGGTTSGNQGPAEYNQLAYKGPDGKAYSSWDWDKATGAPKAGAQPIQGEGYISPIGAGSTGEIQTWYRNLAGKDPDSAGQDYWNKYYAQHGRDATYQAIVQTMKENSPSTLKNMTLEQASQPYTGYQSADGGSVVDEWARNNFGREATAEERQRFGTYQTQAQLQSLYEQFLKEAEARGEVGKGMDLNTASQLRAPLRNDPRTGNLTFIPNTNSQIDAATETIEGRLGNLLALDANGNYTNQVVRQAHDRAKQQFAARGLLNSSMAVQAGQEAVISKAIEIAGPDAERYFQNRRANVDSQNTFARDELNHMYRTDENSQQQSFKREDQDFAMRQDYQKAVQNVSTNYQKQMDTVNASNMTPADKSTAIAQITQQRDGELAYLNNVYSRMPRWQSEWASAAVPTDGVDIASATNVSMLENIANDPAQPAAKREAARTRIAQLRAASPAPAPAPAAPAPASETGMAFA